MIKIYFQQTLAQWRKVFFIASGFWIVDALFYLIFASGSELPWNTKYTYNDRRGTVGSMVADYRKSISSPSFTSNAVLKKRSFSNSVSNTHSNSAYVPERVE